MMRSAKGTKKAPGKNAKQKAGLNRSIAESGWGQFLSFLKYKCEWYGRSLIEIDRWFPSSKRCSNCGHTLEELKLEVRAWECPECGAKHDRDINAALNILAVGQTVSAFGENVSLAPFVQVVLCELGISFSLGSRGCQFKVVYLLHKLNFLICEPWKMSDKAY